MTRDDGSAFQKIPFLHSGGCSERPGAVKGAFFAAQRTLDGEDRSERILAQGMAGHGSLASEGYDPSEVLDKKVGSLIPADINPRTYIGDWFSKRRHFTDTEACKSSRGRLVCSEEFVVSGGRSVCTGGGLACQVQASPCLLGI
jgi:hypothetical protein